MEKPDRSLICCNYSTPRCSAKYCDRRVCLSVRSHISKTARPNLAKFLMYMYVALPMAVARSSSDGVCVVVIRYVLPVLWMTSRIHVTPAAVYVCFCIGKTVPACADLRYSALTIPRPIGLLETQAMTCFRSTLVVKSSQVDFNK